MGAGHSGKHQLGPAIAPADQQQQQQGKQHNTRLSESSSKFGHSFRKGMGNILLNASSTTTKSSQSSKKTKRNSNAIQDQYDNNNEPKINTTNHHHHQHQTAATTTTTTNDESAAKENNINLVGGQYYVPSSSSLLVSQTTAALNNRQQRPAMMNNYVTMQQQHQQQQQQQQQMQTGALVSATSSSSMRGRHLLVVDENGNNNGYVVGLSTHTTPTTPTTTTTATTSATTPRGVYGASATTTTNNKPMEMNSVHRRARSSASSNNNFTALNDPTTNMMAQQHHHLHRAQQQQQQFHQASPTTTTTIQQHPTPPFHLSRAINTKTTSHVLNHHQQQQNNHVNSMNNNRANNNSDCNSSSNSSASTSSPSMQNSGRKLQKQRHNQQQQISSPAIQQQQQQHNLIAHHQQQQQLQHRTTTAAECCLPNYHCNPAASYVSSPHQQQQQQLWMSQQRYKAAEPVSTSFYSTYNDEQRYLQQLDDCDTAGHRTNYLRNSMHDQHQQQPQQQQQPPQHQHHQDPMGYYKQQQQQQFTSPAPHENSYSSHMFATSPTGQLPIHYNRSYSFGSSLTLDSKKIRSQNPLASLFQPIVTTPAANVSNNNNNNNNNKQQYANTIQVTRRNKSAGKLATADSFASQTSNGRSAPGSLKRVKSSLLSAQQASYEAMRTIDMYLIRQIARSCQDFEMEQKIELEIRLRELAAQSICEARNEIDVLEVEKSLLTSDQRMNYYASHLEQQRKKLSNPSLSTDSGRGSKTENHKQQRTTTGTGDTAAARQSRSDVVGGPAGTGSTNGDTSSPSFSSLSNSHSHSPSKLSPVSGQSANGDEPTAAAAAQTNGGTFTSRSHHSRTGLRHSQKSSSSAKSLSARIRAKSKRREQLVQQLAKQNNLDYNSVLDSRASVSVSEIRIPLMWRDVDHFKNRGDYKRFAVFCLLKIDSQIYDTQLITDVDRQVTDVTFDDFIVFNNIDYDFEVTLEVYSCVYLEQFSFSSTPRKLKEKLTSSIGRAMGKRLATQTASPSYTKELEAYDKSYRFSLIASANLQLEDASNSVKTYDLVLMSPNAHNRHHQPTTPNTLSRSYNYQDHYGSSRNSTNSSSAALLTSANTSKNASKNTLPLFGHFCCRLFVRPDVFDKNINSALI